MDTRGRLSWQNPCWNALHRSRTNLTNPLSLGSLSAKIRSSCFKRGLEDLWRSYFLCTREICESSRAKHSVSLFRIKVPTPHVLAHVDFSNITLPCSESSLNRTTTWIFFLRCLITSLREPSISFHESLCVWLILYHLDQFGGSIAWQPLHLRQYAICYGERCIKAS